MDNIKEQADEIEALVSIYGDEWKFEPEIESYSIKINGSIKLYIKLNENYPSMAPPTFELLAPTLTLEQKIRIKNELNSIYEENIGCPVLFQWIEKIKEISDETLINELNFNKDETKEVTNSDNIEIIDTDKSVQLNVIHGSVIVDRKSTFQGHCCSVNSIEEVKMLMDYLMENKKIAQATHNILAYRINQTNGLLQDFDDDGETHAGGRVLHLLQILNVTNVAVVVTRWYGGIHLGPDRFKHINNAARQVLVDAKFVKS